MSTYSGTDAADSLTGTSGDDDFFGLAGKDTLVGLDGEDFLDGGAGADSMVGGAGDDVYWVDKAGDITTELSGEGDNDHVIAFLDWTLAANIEALTLAGELDISGTGNALENLVEGNSGSNVLDGRAGSDTLIGGEGDDTYVVDTSGDTLVEDSDAGADLVRSAISWVLAANFENLELTGTALNATGNSLDNQLTGNARANNLSGGRGDDTLDGRGGLDVMTGGRGDDLYVVNRAGDQVIENSGAGVDTVQASSSYTLGSNLEHLVLTGEADNAGFGNELDNSIQGNTGKNTLTGDDGDDSIDGGAGADSIDAGAGRDVVVYDAQDSADGGNARDTLIVQSGGETDLAAATAFSSFEVIDLTSQTNSLVVATDRVLSLSSTDTLRILGDDDTVTANGTWSSVGNFSDDFGSFVRYVDGSAVLEVASSVVVHITVQLSSLDGAHGFQISGEHAYDRSGLSVSDAGDVNGDGLADILIGSPNSSVNGTYSGASYVVFGRASGFSANLKLSALDGTNGFQISGENDFDEAGSVSSAGDVNGDGMADILIGADGADPHGYDTWTGAGYVVFGKSSGFVSNLQLAALNGTNGFQISGNVEIGSPRMGASVSGIGDLNDDGIADIAIGAPGAFPHDIYEAGATYIVFGSTAGFASNLEASTLDGVNGFKISGESSSDNSGRSVSSAGDFDGDGIADIVIGARDVSYIVLGQASGFASNLDLSALDGENGFRISGQSSGASVSDAGDVNGDGFSDLLIGAPFADTPATDGGATYVVFGTTASGFASNLELSTLDGANGFRISGEAVLGYSGWSVSSAGDVNGDGFADILVGAYGAYPNGSDSGASYVVFGKASGFASNLNLSALSAADGFRIAGEGTEDQSGFSVSRAGDVNGDGLGDLIIGAPGDPHAGEKGASYVVFGFNAATATNDSLSGTNGADRIAGSLGDDTLRGGAGDDTLLGGAGDDSLAGGAGNDYLAGGLGDDTYVVDSAWDRVAEESAGGTDTVRSAVDFTLKQDLENLVLTGTSAMDGSGNAKANTIAGNAGSNHLTGGGGADAFVFDAALNAADNLDVINDFQGFDEIRLDQSIFAAFGSTGAIGANQLELEANEASINDTSGTAQSLLKYAQDTGWLYYDANGSAAGGLTKFAQITTDGSTAYGLASTDIIVV